MLTNLKLLFYIEALFGIAFFVFHQCLSRPMRGLIKPGYVALVLAIPVVGLFGRNREIFYSFVFLIPLLLVADRRRLACVFALILPLFPDLSGMYAVGSFYLLDFSAPKALLFGVLIALMMAGSRQARRIGAMDASLWLFLLVFLISIAHGLPIGGVVRQVAVTVLLTVPAFYVMARCIRTPREAGDVTLFFLLGAFCNAVIATFEMKRSWPLFQAFNTALNVPAGLSATLSIRAGFMRAQGAINNPTTISVLLALAVVACLSMKSRFSVWGYRVVMATLVVGLIASQSRGGWAAAGVGVALYWLYERRTTAFAALAGTAVVGWLLVTALPTGGQIGQLLGRSGAAQMTADYRSDLFSRGLEEVRKHPLRGQTKEQLEISMDDMRQGDHIIDFVNTHLFIALKTGLIGFAAWMIAWGVALMCVWQVRPRRVPQAHEFTAAAPFGMIGACFVALTFTSTIDRMIPFLTLSLGLGSAFVALARQRGTGSLSAMKRPPGLIAPGIAAIRRQPDHPVGNAPA